MHVYAQLSSAKRFVAFVSLFTLVGCAGPSIESKDPWKRTLAVREGNLDQQTLSRLAIEDESGGVRRAAVRKLTDKTMLARIAKEDNDSDVSQAAFEKLNNIDESIFVAAVKSGDVDKIKTSLTQQVSAAELSISLFSAVINGSWQLCDILIKAGADLNSTDGRGDTPLMISIKMNKRDIAIQLIKLNADVSVKNKINANALLLAASDEELARTLLKNNVTITEVKADNTNHGLLAPSYQWLASFMEQEYKQGQLSTKSISEIKNAYAIAAKHFDVLQVYYADNIGEDVTNSVIGGMTVLSNFNFSNLQYSINSAKTNAEKSTFAQKQAQLCRKKIDCYNNVIPGQELTCINFK